MVKTIYERAELLANDPGLTPHEEVGYQLHGGFDAQDNYVSPRTWHRWPAVREWGAQLVARGWPLIDSTTDLLHRGSYPNQAQSKLLLANGYGEFLWNSLTVTGIIEARGRALVDLVAPDFQNFIVEDISQTCTGHLHKGLLWAHGADEGGSPDEPHLGAHDQMWFAARDLLFGKNAYPIPEVPESISRPDQGRQMPQIHEGLEQLILLMMNVLMIEVRAESFFAFCCDLMRDPATFTDRRADADLAALMVERIRMDEAIHVAYLQAAISEMRSFTFRTVDGGTIAGKDLIDPVWAGMVHWHSVTEAELSKIRGREAIQTRLPAGLFGEFDALDDETRKAA